MRPWKIADALDTSAFVNTFRVHPAIAQVLMNRGLDVEGAKRFLEKPAYHDPLLLPDMMVAVERLRQAKERQEKVMIYRDYDVDGVMAGVILTKGFKAFGLNHVSMFSPNRFETGYGLHVDTIREIADQGYDLIVTVDCGISSLEEIRLANDLGVDVIVTDHHEPGPELPNAVAVVNPKRHDSIYPFREICGAAVAWKLVQALNEDELADLIDLVATATVADVVPLVDENRRIVIDGLHFFNQGKGNLGLRELKNAAGLEGDFDSFAIGFGIGPRINAVGRLGDSNSLPELFLTNSEHKASQMAAVLEKINATRRSLTDKNVEEALRLVKEQWDPERENIVVVASDQFHAGVVGIVASKLMEICGRPVVLISLEEDGPSRGSCRSFGPVHLFEALQANSQHLIQFGGHAAAAGLSIDADKVDGFRTAINEWASRFAPEEFLLPVEIDRVIDLEETGEYLVAQMELLAPFGEGNPAPTFAVEGVEVEEISVLKEKHLKLQVRDIVSREVIAFGWAEWALENNVEEGTVLDIAFRPSLNHFRGQANLVLEAVDIRISSSTRKASSASVDIEQTTPEELGRLLFGEQRQRFDEHAGKYEGIQHANHFHTKVAGVTFGGRQDIVKRLEEGEVLHVRREPDNPMDPNAIGLYTTGNQHVGYINATLAKVLAPEIDAGAVYVAFVDHVTGRNGDGHLGLNILVERRGQDEAPLISQDTPPLPLEERKKIPVEDTLEYIREHLLGGYEFRPKQWEAIQVGLAGDDALVVMGTGRGKSVIFQTVAAYNALTEGKRSIIFYPLKALLNDQYATLTKVLAPLGLRVAMASGTLTQEERSQLFASLEETDILLATPEFVIYHRDKFQSFLEEVAFVVLDEAHHICDDRFGYQQMAQFINDIGASFMMVSATVDEAAYEKIRSQMPPKHVVVDNHQRNNLHIVDERNIKDKLSYVINVVDKGEKTLVFCNSRQQTTVLAESIRSYLMETGRQREVAYYNAGLDSDTRGAIERMFADGRLKVVVATSAFGEGVDIPDVRHVIHYHLPLDQTGFLQQSGRAGRDGGDSHVHLIFGESDKRINRFIIDERFPTKEALVGVLKVLGQLGKKNPKITASDSEIQELVAEMIGESVPLQSIQTSLGVLEELDLIQVTWGPKRSVEFHNLRRTELHNAVIYSEAVRERRLFDSYMSWIETVTAEEIEAMISRPYFPSLSTALATSQEH